MVIFSLLLQIDDRSPFRHEYGKEKEARTERTL